MGARAALAGILGAIVIAFGCSPAPRPRPVTPPPPAPVAAPTVETTDDAEEPQADDGTADDGTPAAPSPCPEGMALVATADKRFCVDKWEASLVETIADGTEQPYPHYQAVDGHTVRAVSRPGVFPQGFISEVQAQDACAASAKRLCVPDEWKTACMGPAKTTFPYGDARRPGICHDTGKSAVGAVFGAKAIAASAPPPAATGKTPAKSGKKGRGTKTTAKTTPQKRTGAGTASKTTAKTSAKHRGTPAKKSTKPASVADSVWTKLNDPLLGQVEGALARTGEHEECVNGFGVFDMVGNLHEWIVTDAAIPHGTFAGGYYLDTALNGDGCNYRTTAHAHDYHDYSTGFRCCADAGPASESP